MWLRYYRLFLVALFVWVAVLGFRTGSWRIVIAPFLALGALMLVETKLRMIFPEFGPKLSASLVTLVLVYNVYVSIPSLQMWLASQLPQTAGEAERLKRRADLSTAERLDAAAAELAAREALHTYLLRKEDIVGEQIKAELDTLNAKRQRGTFGPEDEKAEREVLRRYQKLVEERKELQQVIEGSSDEQSLPERSLGGSAANPDLPTQKKTRDSRNQTREMGRSTPPSNESPAANLPAQRDPSQTSEVTLNAPPPSQGATPPRNIAPAGSYDNGYFHVALLKCSRSGSQVNCSGKVEVSAGSAAYEGSDGTVLIVFHRFTIGDEGATNYTVSAGSFGENRCMGTGYCSQKITPGIPSSFSFIIDHVDQAASTLNVVMPNNQGENAVFRAVPIQ